MDPQIAPDAPWLPNAQNFQDVDLSDDEDDFYFMDSEKQQEEKTNKRAKKFNELKENYSVSAEPFAFQAVQKLDIFNNAGTGKMICRLEKVNGGPVFKTSPFRHNFALICRHIVLFKSYVVLGNALQTLL